jgi:homospermidine synthase
VTAAVLAGLVWVIENPEAGVVEADEIGHARILEIAGPYLGELVGAYSDWTPLQDRARLFPEDLDAADPWQFKNVRVS